MKTESDFIGFETLLKARAAEEGGERFLYLEASREGPDQQNEYVLAKALEESSGHFLKFGNIDIDHKSIPQIAAKYGISNPEEWEIGIPEDVKIDGQSVFVKARLFKGDTDLASKADMVWNSLTKLDPPARWYASVGGATLAKSPGIDPETNSKVNFVTKVRWTNLAISRQPVNQHVAAAQIVPFGSLAKCWTPGGLDLFKALEAGATPDVAELTGGGALGKQSIDTGSQPDSYHEFRSKLSEALLRGLVPRQNAEALTDFSVNAFNLARADAHGWVKRFLKDVNKGLKHNLNRRNT